MAADAEMTGARAGEVSTRAGVRATPRRRRLLTGGSAVVVLATLVPGARAADAPGAAGAGLAAAIAAFTGGKPVTTGRVTLDIAELVENGNVVPVTVKVDSPMTERDHVRRIGLFNEKNPENDIARFELGPRAGRAEVATRVRLATSQRVVAVAETSEGRFWSGAVDVIVMLAACVE